MGFGAGDKRQRGDARLIFIKIKMFQGEGAGCLHAHTDGTRVCVVGHIQHATEKRTFCTPVKDKRNTLQRSCPVILQPNGPLSNTSTQKQFVGMTSTLDPFVFYFLLC